MAEKSKLQGSDRFYGESLEWEHVRRTIESNTNHTVKGAGLVIQPIPLSQTIANDGIKHAYTADHAIELMAMAKRLGPVRMQIRCQLSRYDWDLIHNHVVSFINSQTDESELEHALLRMIIKVHEQRIFIDRVTDNKLLLPPAKSDNPFSQ